MSSEQHINRRNFVVGGASALAASMAWQPAYASRLQLLRLHPSRFISGLVFDVAYAVFVEVAADAVVRAVRSGRRSMFPSAGRMRASVVAPRQIVREPVFDMEAYKASIVTLGLVDYRLERNERIRVMLRDAKDDDIRRYEEMRLYLHTERVPLVPDGKNLSFLVERETPFDQILSTQAVDLPEASKRRHVENLIAVTGANVFDSYI